MAKMTVIATKSTRLLRWPEVQPRVGISKSTWERGIRAGIYPRPVKLGPPPARAVGWLESDIDRLIASLS
jgi:prophage regulatory protein